MSRVTLPAVSAEGRVLVPGAVKYSQDFEASLDSWSASAGSVSWAEVDPAFGAAHSGTFAAFVAPASSGTTTVSRSISGLTVGREYIFSAWCKRLTPFTPVGTVKVGVNGIGASTAITPPTWIWAKLSYRFTATATSHTFELTYLSGGNYMGHHWDDVRLVEAWRVTDTFSLDLLDGSTITLDERTAPYVQARLKIALPDQTTLDKLDTRSSTSQVRVFVTAGQSFIAPAGSPQARTFDLLLHERDGRHERSSDVTLVCHSDEALLIDAGNDTASVDSSLLTNQKSIRGMIEQTIEPYGAVLEPGTADADFTVTSEIVNMHIDPSAESSPPGHYIVSSSVSAVARSSTFQNYGSYSARYTVSAASASCIVGPDANGYSVTAGKTYTWAVYVRSQVSRSGTVAITWRDSSNSAISTSSVAITTSASGFARHSVTAVAPANAVKATPLINTTSNVSGQFHYLDGAMFYEGAELVTYFDGTTPTDTYYSYAWTGTANNSTSRRIRLDNRDPKLLYQEPGEKDWDILQQMVQVAGLRLFCDEQRKWRLVDPATYTVAGTAHLEGARSGSDKISRESGDWCDAVVVKYTWIGTDGLQKEAYDAATAGGTCLLKIEWNRPYPGPGAAAAILARYQGRGRVQELIAPLDLTPTPGMALTTALPNTPDQEGSVSRVVWSIGGKYETRVTARDLEDA